MTPRPAIPRAVWALGLTSMLMDVSSEMIHALLPVYLTAVLGISVAAVGWIEGVAEATALAVKVFSGALSDWLGKRKALALAGYAMAALTKPVFPLATGAGEVIAARFVDRIGKGVRGAPRDALIADVTPEAIRGAAFGLRQSLDTLGAFIGPALAIALMLWSANDYRLVFWLAVIPAFLAVAVLAFGVVETDAKPGARTNPLSRAAMRGLPRAFWLVVTLGAALSFARVSEAFLILRATENGLAAALAPAVLAAMSLVYAAGAWPAGVLADKLDRRALLVLAILSLALAEGVLALTMACSSSSSASRCGARTSPCRRGCWRRSSPTRRQRRCAPQASACSTSPARLPFSPAMSSSAPSGPAGARARPMDWRPLSRWRSRLWRSPIARRRSR